MKYIIYTCCLQKLVSTRTKVYWISGPFWYFCMVCQMALSIFLFLSNYVSIYLSIYLSIYRFLSLLIHFWYIHIYYPISIYPSSYISNLSIYWDNWGTIGLLVLCLFIGLFICLFICLSHQDRYYLSVSLSMYLSI